MPPDRHGVLLTLEWAAPWCLEEDPEPPMRVLGGHIHKALGPFRKERALAVDPVIGAALIRIESEQGVAKVAQRRASALVEDE